MQADPVRLWQRRKILLLICLNTRLLLLPMPAQTANDAEMSPRQQFEQADARMNQVYKQIFSEYQRETLFLEKLKAAQRAWVAYRDADLASLYPAADKLKAYGSEYQNCQYQVLATLTNQRAAELKKWIVGVEEGDVCSGSIRVKP